MADGVAFAAAPAVAQWPPMAKVAAEEVVTRAASLRGGSGPAVDVAVAVVGVEGLALKPDLAVAGSETLVPASTPILASVTSVARSCKHHAAQGRRCRYRYDQCVLRLFQSSDEGHVCEL